MAISRRRGFLVMAVPEIVTGAGAHQFLIAHAASNLAGKALDQYRVDGIICRIVFLAERKDRRRQWWPR